MLKSKILISAVSILITLSSVFAAPVTYAVKESGETSQTKSSERFVSREAEYICSVLSNSPIETKRLIITPINETNKEEEFKKIAKYLLDKEVTKYLEMDPNAPIRKGFKDETVAFNYLMNCNSSDDDFEKTAEFTIKLKDSNESIGYISLSVIKDDSQCKKLYPGYWLGKDYWCNGYLPEAAIALCNKAINLPLPIMGFEVYIDPKNTGSIKAAKKIFETVMSANSNMDLRLYKDSYSEFVMLALYRYGDK